MTQSETIGQLVAALGAIMAEVGYVRGTGRNDHHGYKYTSDEDLAAAIQPALVSHGCALLPVRTVTEREGSRTIITVTWRVAHKSGEWMQVETVGEGIDKQDKATAKALTGARKYAMRLLFCVPTGDDNEKEDRVAAKQSHQRADFSPFVKNLLAQIQELQDAGVKNADAAARKVRQTASAGLSDDELLESLAKLIDWLEAARLDLAGASDSDEEDLH